MQAASEPRWSRSSRTKTADLALWCQRKHAAVRKQFCVVESYDRSSTRHGVCDESPACEYRRRVRQPLPRLAAAREPQQRRRKQRMPRHRSGCFGATSGTYGGHRSR